MTESASVFGCDVAHATELVHSVSQEPTLTIDQVRDRFARAAWMTMAESGDGVVGAVIRAATASGGLEALLAVHVGENAGARFRSRLVDAGARAVDLPTAETLEQAMERWRPRRSANLVVRSIAHAAQVGAILLTPDTDWPVGLDDLGDHAPFALWARGRRELVGTLARSVSIVGARAATGYGEHVAADLSAGLVDRGLSIVSGAAYGIDGAAHRAALNSDGTTAAFLAGGVDRFYPAGHDGLLRMIAQGGLVLSESPCGAAPTKWRFLKRNRLIAATGRATIVVEAGMRSGSLNTAGHAATLGRSVGAVPGPVTSPSSAGCHRLIREYDAACVTGVEDVLELIDGIEATRGAGPAAGSGPRRVPEHMRTLDAMSTRTARTAFDIAVLSGLSPEQTRSALGLLELEGEVRERDAGWVVISRR